MPLLLAAVLERRGKRETEYLPERAWDSFHPYTQWLLAAYLHGPDGADLSQGREEGLTVGVVQGVTR